MATALAVPLAHEARAGCPSTDGCEQAVGLRASLDPAEPCLDVRTTEDDCECLSWVSLENHCSVSLQAGDFGFDFCRIDGETRQENCPDLIPPDSWGAVYIPVDPATQLGEHEDVLHLSVSGRELALRVRYEMVAVEGGCGCASFPGRPPDVVLAVVIAIGFRPRPRSRARPRG